MACILKRPDGAKGVITFTTQERDKLIFQDESIFNKIVSLKQSYVVGLHHNWHDYGFHWNPVFDFSMAGPGDLGSSNVPLVTLDACNFIPNDFRSSTSEKHWDILYVTRAVYFKRVDVFLRTIKQIYSSGRRPRVLLLCCIPPEDATPKNIVEDYMAMFTQEERKYFTLLPLAHDYPFCLDPGTVGYLYRSSKIFTHFANDERRCRVVANAAATQMPIVCMRDPASIIPESLRKPPYLYLVENDDDFFSKITKALDDYDSSRDLSEVSKHFSVQYTSEEVKRQLERFLGISVASMENCSFNFNNLDIRLGRHHSISYGPNKVDMTISNFVDFITNDRVLNELWDSSSPDIEKKICQIL